MNFKTLFLGLLPIVVLTVGCSKTTVQGVEEGVVVKKPWFFGYEGVVEEAKFTGTHFHFLTTTIHTFKSIPFQENERFVDLISEDRKPIDIDVYLQLKLIRGTSPQLYKDFGFRAYKDNISKPFRSAFREIAKRYSMWELVESAKIMREIENESKLRLETILKTKGIPFEVLGVEVSKANPPDEVKAEVARTAAQTQRKETEEARRAAEDVRKLAETARANADKAYQSAMELSPGQYIELMKIDAQYKLIEMIKEKKEPMTLLVGVDGVAVPAK